MKYAIVISASKTKFGPIVFREDLENNIIKAKEIGYDGIELSVKNPGAVNIKRVKKVLRTSCLDILTIGTGQIYFDEGLSFSDPDEAIREGAVKKTKEVIDLANNFNSSVIIGLIRGKIDTTGNDFKATMERAEERLCRCFEDCLRYSEKYETKFLIEPINRYETNIFNRLDEVDMFLKKYKDILDIERIGVLADTFHMNIEEPVIEESLHTYFNIIKHIHFADSNRWAPGFGHTDFKKILKVLRNNKYDNFISFEIFPYPEPDISARKALEFIKNMDFKSGV